MKMNIQLIDPKPINKIVVVGHPLSGYQGVEALLNSCGMNPAHRSRRDGFLPTEITATICKAHRIPPIDPHHSGGDIEQIEAGPIWHGMALDLLLGNIDEALWGWADPQLVYLLDYWKSLDPQIAFVLVYDTPQDLVISAFDEKTPLTPDALRQATGNWFAFNAALLHFFHRNSERCLLVNAQQVRESASIYLQQVRTRIGAPVLIDKPQTTAVELIADATPDRAVPAQQDALRSYLASALIQQQPDILQLYEELQSVASLPRVEPQVATFSTFDAWSSLTHLQIRNKEQSTQAFAHDQAQQAHIDALNRDLSGAERLASEHKNDLKKLRQEIALLSAQSVNQPVSGSAELQQANEHLLLQLHHAQEELEHYYLESRKLTKKSAPSAYRTKSAHYGAADRIKRQLSYRLGATMIEQSRSAKGWLVMPSALLKQVREFEKEKKSRGDTQLPPINKYADAHEAERVRQHLSYRLGNAMVVSSRTPLGWLKMPWALRREVLDFQRIRGIKKA